jgi:hypothetical protein
VVRQQRRLVSRFFRLLDGSFLFRLALSGAAAMALLLLVNSYATCRNNRWAPGCLWRDAEALISVGNVESLSIVTAAFLYVLEAQKRRQRDNIEAYELLMNCNASGVKWLVGRISALEILNSSGLPIDGQQLAGFDLRNLQAANGHWHNVNLEGSVLRQANLAGTDLSGSNLRGADLRDAAQEQQVGRLVELPHGGEPGASPPAPPNASSNPFREACARLYPDVEVVHRTIPFSRANPTSLPNVQDTSFTPFTRTSRADG